MYQLNIFGSRQINQKTYKYKYQTQSFLVDLRNKKKNIKIIKHLKNV